MFTINDSTVSSNVYTVEQLTLGEDGIVEVSAVEFPTDAGYVSLIAQDVVDSGRFTVAD